MIVRSLMVLLAVVIAACSGEQQDDAQKDSTNSTGRAVDTPATVSRTSEPWKAKAPADSIVPIWQGISDGYTIIWNWKDVVASAGGKGAARFSLHDLLEHDWVMSFPEPEFARGCSSEYSIRILSVVGSLISMEQSEYGECPGAAHPGLLTSYEVITLANPDRRIPLTHYFDENDIYQALINDGIVKKVLVAEKIPPPATLEQLVHELSGAITFCEYGFESNLLTHFAFHHIEGDKVAVRLGVSHGAGACRGMLTQIGILLPIPEHLSGALKKANARDEGFLMKDLESIAGKEGGSLITLTDRNLKNLPRNSEGDGQ